MEDMPVRIFHCLSGEQSKIARDGPESREAWLIIQELEPATPPATFIPPPQPIDSKISLYKPENDV